MYLHTKYKDRTNYRELGRVHITLAEDCVLFTWHYCAAIWRIVGNIAMTLKMHYVHEKFGQTREGPQDRYQKITDCRDELLSARSLQLHTNTVMSLEEIFGCISSKSWTDLDKNWQRDGEWGKSDPIKFLAKRADMDASPLLADSCSGFWAPMQFLI